MLSKLAVYTATAISFAYLADSQQLAQDPCRGGTPVEVVHLYYDEFPQGKTHVRPSRSPRII